MTAHSRISFIPRRVRTLFLSDIHLGSRAAQADQLVDFLRHHEAETIYLVGDIVDGWRLRRAWHWPQSHNNVVQAILKKARRGTRVVYVPGNHDEFLRDFPGEHFGGIEVLRNTIHEGADGRRYLVTHGDEYDVVVCHARIIAYLGDWSYDAAIWLNHKLNWVRRKLGLPYWSLSAWAKLRVKNAVSFIGAFEDALSSEARRRECNGVICGHIHHARIEETDGFSYVNTGDWVESCTAVAERSDGSLELLTWSDVRASELLAPPQEAGGMAEKARPAKVA